MALLEIKNLTKKFGGLAAVNNLSFNTEEGEILGLIGPNGAGKSTFFNLVTSCYKPTKGNIIFKNKDITNLKTHKIAALGIARTFQKTSVFMEMSVLENILIAQNINCKVSLINQFLGTGQTKKVGKEIYENTMKIIEFFSLDNYKDVTAKSLPHGILRLLGIAMAMSLNPKLLLLDEPFTGMNTGEVNQVLDLMRNINNRGITILLVEHNMLAILEISHRVVVLDFGEKIAEGKPKTCINEKKVIEAYLGKEIE